MSEHDGKDVYDFIRSLPDEDFKFYFDSVRDFFNTEEEFVDFFKRFKRFKDFRWSIPLRVCQMLWLKKELDKTGVHSDSFKLIVLTSVIEVLKTKEPFMDFPEWYKKNNEGQKSKKCFASWQDYNEIHGGR